MWAFHILLAFMGCRTRLYNNIPINNDVGSIFVFIKYFQNKLYYIILLCCNYFIMSKVHPFRFNYKDPIITNTNNASILYSNMPQLFPYFLMTTLRAHGFFVPFTLLLENDGHIVSRSICLV